MGGWTKFNGWTNYATWRVNLELIDDIDTDFWQQQIEMYRGEGQSYKLGEDIREYVEELLEQDCVNEITAGYAYAFVRDVNWSEIAGHVIDTYKENYCCHNCGEAHEQYGNYCSTKCEKEHGLLATLPKG